MLNACRSAAFGSSAGVYGFAAGPAIDGNVAVIGYSLGGTVAQTLAQGGVVAIAAYRDKHFQGYALRTADGETLVAWYRAPRRLCRTTAASLSSPNFASVHS